MKEDSVKQDSSNVKTLDYEQMKEKMSIDKAKLTEKNAKKY